MKPFEDQLAAINRAHGRDLVVCCVLAFLAGIGAGYLLLGVSQ